MANVAAIREKFLQRDASKESVLPSPNLSSNGVTLSKNESPYKFSTQRPPSSCSASSSNHYQKKPPHLPSSTKAAISKIMSPSLKPAHSNSSVTELGRSSSLTDLTELDSEKQHKGLNSIGSLSSSSDFDSPKSEMSCLVSELKSRFEQNESNLHFSKRYMVGKHDPMNTCKQESNQKPPVLKLKPNSLILSLNANNENVSAKDSLQKGKGIDKGSLILTSSTSVLTCAKAQNDLSSISTSNSNLSETFRNDCVKEEQTVEAKSSLTEVFQSEDDPSFVANVDFSSGRMKLCRRKRLLSLHELGPPPVKPSKPLFLKSSSLTSASNAKVFTFHEKDSSSSFNLLQPPKRPPPKPPNDGSGKPLPPLPISEDIYDDSQNEEHIGTTPDVILDDNESQSYSHSQPTSNTTYDVDDLYHDIQNDQQQDRDDIYEIMEIDPCQTDGNLKEETREEFDEKKQKREKEKKDKELAKIKEKFNLTGEEFSTVMGTVKKTVKARGNDLSVKEGEMVTIFRMENNPSGKWLVKNEKGKVGYVELSNIQIDPENVKSVMHTSYKYSSFYRASEEYIYENEEDDIYQDIGDYYCNNLR